MAGINDTKFNFEKVVDKKPDGNGEVQMSAKEKLQAELELTKLQKEIEAQKLGFADFEAFKKAKQSIELKESELVKREDTIKTQEEILTKREADCARAGERNEVVKANLISHELQDYKRDEAVRKYAFQNYFATFDMLCSKLINAKSGENCLGLVQRGKRKVDEAVAIDVVFLEEIKPLIKSIQTALKVSPKFSSEGEYITQDEQILEEENEDEES
jgi:hypothetical protein